MSKRTDKFIKEFERKQAHYKLLHEEVLREHQEELAQRKLSADKAEIDLRAYLKKTQVEVQDHQWTMAYVDPIIAWCGEIGQRFGEIVRWVWNLVTFRSKKFYAPNYIQDDPDPQVVREDYPGRWTDTGQEPEQALKELGCRNKPIRLEDGSIYNYKNLINPSTDEQEEQ